MGLSKEKNITEEQRLTIVKLLVHVKQTYVEYVFQVCLLDRKWDTRKHKEGCAGCQADEYIDPFVFKMDKSITFDTV